MRTALAASILAAFASLALPANAGEAGHAAWSAVQKINEMAEEARVRCADEQRTECGAAAAMAGASFALVQDAKKCDTGRYPMTCDRLRGALGEIDALYERYHRETAPERVAANRARLRACHVLPMTGACDPATGIVQTQLNAQ